MKSQIFKFNNKGFTLFETAILIAIISIAIIPIYKKTSTLVDRRKDSLEISKMQNSINEIYEEIIISAEKDYTDFLGHNEMNTEDFNIFMLGNKVFHEDIEYSMCSKNILELDIEIYRSENSTKMAESRFLINIIE